MGPRFDHHLFFDPFQILIIFYDSPDLPVAMGFLKTLPHLLECSKNLTFLPLEAFYEANIHIGIKTTLFLPLEAFYEEEVRPLQLPW